MSEQENVAIACNISAIKAEDRPQHEQTVDALFGEVLEVQERPDGYAFRLPTDSTALMRAAQWISNERLCCPFFEFTLKIEPNQGGLWLWVTGSAEVKEFIRMEFGAVLSPVLAGSLGGQ
jgi:hypothetical protein